MDGRIDFLRSDDLLEITLNRPEAGNRVTNAMGAELVEALVGVGPGTKLVVLRGAGANFCVGRESPMIDRATASAQVFKDQIAAPPLALYQAFRDCRAPVLGVVQGRAAGVGCALAALCDVAVAAEDATFFLPELMHGIPPTLVMTALGGRVPYQMIAYMVLTGEPVTAGRAASFGLVAATTAPGSLEEEAGRLIGALRDRPADALHGVKEFLREGVETRMPNASTLAANLIATVLSSRPKS